MIKLELGENNWKAVSHDARVCMDSLRLCSLARVLGWTIPLKGMTDFHKLQVARMPLTSLYSAEPVG